MLTDLRLKINNFFRKYKWRIILFIIFWAVLMVLSQILQNTKNETPITTFSMFEPVIENGHTTPQKWEDEIEKTVEEYIGYCNEKEYEKAYNMINEDCKKNVYPTLDSFKGYVDYVFSQKRLYSLKNYSNTEETYLYRLRIFEDIMATGLTYSSAFRYFEEIISFTEKDGKLLLSLQEYIGSEELSSVYDDQYMRIMVTDKIVKYDSETYVLKLKNKTEYTIVISDQIAEGDILLVTKNGEIERTIDENWSTILLPAGVERTATITFPKFYDKDIESTGLKFNDIRVLRSYSDSEELKEQELENAVQIFSTTISVK